MAATRRWWVSMMRRRASAAAAKIPADGLAFAAPRISKSSCSLAALRRRDAATLRDYIVSDSFELAAFKGKPLTFRKWDQQLRQPILLATPLMLVSVSPQEEFLHERTPLDSLGHDLPDSTCRLNQ